MARTYNDGSELYGPELYSYINDVHANGTAILNGCTPTPGTNALDVDVAAGEVIVDYNPNIVNSQTVTLDSRDNYDRYDVISIDKAGNAAKTTGTDATVPLVPVSEALAAIVYVPSDSGTSITVYDARTLSESSHQADPDVDRVLQPPAYQSSHTATEGEIWLRTDLDPPELRWHDGSVRSVALEGVGDSSGTTALRVELGALGITGTYTVNDTTDLTTALNSLRWNNDGTIYTVAPPEPLIDSFEDQDLSEYGLDTGSVTIQSNTVEHKSYAAKIAAGQNRILSDTDTATFGDQSDTLANYPSQGDVWEVYHNFPAGARPKIYYGIQDADNYYTVELDDSNGIFKWDKVSSGSVVDTTNTGVTFDNDAWVRTQVEWRTNGRMLIDYEDSSGTIQASLDVTDDTWSSGGVGWGEWSSQQVTDGLHLWWEIDEGSGTTVFDSSGNNRDGGIFGASWTTDSKTGGQALDFDGVDDYVERSDMGQTFSTHTQSAWFKPTNTTQTDFAKVWTVLRSDNGVSAFAQIDDNNQYEYGVGVGDGNSAAVNSGVSLSTDWVHIAGTYDGSDINVYIDGTLEGSLTTSHESNFEHLGLGAYINRDQQYGEGIIDDFRLYNRALSASEIQTIYDNTK